jgi:type IV secretion system protein VirB9
MKIMTFERKLMLKLCRVLVAAVAFAGMVATPAFADPRIRTVTWREDRVIGLIGHYGYQIAIEFPDGDYIESVAIGDSLTWQATPNKRGDALFIKPVDQGEATNMTVLTSNRSYNFELVAKRRDATTPGSEITYLLRIKLPEAAEKPGDLKEPLPALVEHLDHNKRYSYLGSAENLPSRVFDDGKSTTFEWPEGVETPAIFVRRPDGKESIVNFSYQGKAIVVHQVAREFILRNGKDVTRVFNDGFTPVARGPEAPQPRDAKKRSFLGLF